jgi:transposase
MGTDRRQRVRPTHEWELLVPLFEWPEQERYEQIRPLVLFDVAVAERADEVGVSASTLYRRLDRFAEDGMESLIDAPTAKRRRLPPAVRRLIVDLKAEHPAFNLNEIANVVHACFGRRPDYRSVARVLSEEPVPLKIVRNYPPYHEARDVREARAAVVELRLSGWSVKAIADYLGVHHSTVYRALERWKEKGFEGLADGSPGRPPGVRKADFAAVEAIRRLAQNPGLGAFRVHAAMRQWASTSPAPPAAEYSPKSEISTSTRNPRAAAVRRKRCLSLRSGTTNTGPPTCATWTCSTRGCSPRAWSTP